MARSLVPGRFASAVVRTDGGELEARLSDGGNWQIKVRWADEAEWRLLCMGHLDGRALAPSPPEPPAPINIGPFSFDFVRRRVAIEGVDQPLRPREFDLLSLLAAEPDRLFTKKELGRKLPAGWLAGFEADRAAAFEMDLAPVAGIDAVLEEAVAAGIPMCVASQARREKTALTLGLTGLSRFFPEAVLFSSTMVEHGKPHPGLFLLAAEAMGFDPADCVVVEDGMLGVEAGREAGMRVLGYAPAGCDPDRLSIKGAEVFRAMADLPVLLGF
jgi:HAD superfamily hydrolase (TIGR01509 family)